MAKKLKIIEGVNDVGALRAKLRKLEGQLPEAEAMLPSEDECMDDPKRCREDILRKLKEVQSIIHSIIAYNED